MQRTSPPKKSSIPFSRISPAFERRDAGTAGVLACCVPHLYLLGNQAGEDACGPSITSLEFYKTPLKEPLLTYF